MGPEKISLRILPAPRVRPAKRHRREDRDDYLIRQKRCGTWTSE
jgi:hypothetical protein